LKVDVNLSSFFKPGSEIRESMDFMDQEMTGTMDLRIRLEADMKDPSILKKVDTLQQFIEKTELITVTNSISDAVKQMHRIVMDDSLVYETIPNEKEKINNLFSMYSLSGTIENFSTLVNEEYSSGLITSFSRVMSTNQVFSFIEKISFYISSKFDNNISIDITGMIVVIRDMVILIIKSSIMSILLSLLFVIIVASLFFKRFIWGLLAVLPLSGAVLLNFGLMGHFGITLNHITAILSSIIIGVGIDFAIHFIAQYRMFQKNNVKKNLTRKTFKEAGYPILLDAASNMGFGALLFSSFIPVQFIGGLMVFAMISTSFGTLIILASLMQIIKKYILTN
jgi:predicted RND superfamily exporter protein